MQVFTHSAKSVNIYPDVRSRWWSHVDTEYLAPTSGDWLGSLMGFGPARILVKPVMGFTSTADLGTTSHLPVAPAQPASVGPKSAFLSPGWLGEYPAQPGVNGYLLPGINASGALLGVKCTVPPEK